MSHVCQLSVDKGQMSFCEVLWGALDWILLPLIKRISFNYNG